MKNIDVEPTAQMIDQSVIILSSAIRELERTARKMRESSDITLASEAISIIVNIPQQTRVDLLVTRPIRSLMKQEDN